MVRGGQTMTRKEVKNLVPILQAFAEGRVIQYKDQGVWRDITTEEGLFIENAFVNVNDYRIKPELTYRPFANAEECWEEMQKHQPFGWLKSKATKDNILITAVSNSCCVVNGGNCGFDFLLEKFTFFDDGSAVGIKAESEG